ncbi:hypothetical protein, partial [Pantoea sp. Ft+CA_17]|uniref:hypothetical protein n=1 Tax=Pantoea sp. Ft+CA_17 TaxID=2929508 RepID=UPI00211838C5
LNLMSEKLKQDHYKVAPKKKGSSEASPSNGGGDPIAIGLEGAYLAGRGAQFNTKNRFLKNEKTREYIEGIDDWEESNVATQY